MQSHHSRTPGEGATADGAEEVDEHRMASRSVCWFRSKSTFGAGAVLGGKDHVQRHQESVLAEQPAQFLGQIYLVENLQI